MHPLNMQLVVTNSNKIQIFEFSVWMSFTKRQKYGFPLIPFLRGGHAGLSVPVHPFGGPLKGALKKETLFFVFGCQKRPKKAENDSFLIFLPIFADWNRKHGRPLVLISNNHSRWGVSSFGSGSAVPSLGESELFSSRNFWFFHPNFLRRIWIFHFRKSASKERSKPGITIP